MQLHRLGHPGCSAQQSAKVRAENLPRSRHTSTRPVISIVIPTQGAAADFGLALSQGALLCVGRTSAGASLDIVPEMALAQSARPILPIHAIGKLGEVALYLAATPTGVPCNVQTALVFAKQGIAPRMMAPATSQSRQSARELRQCILMLLSFLGPRQLFAQVFASVAAVRVHYHSRWAFFGHWKA